MAGLSDFHAEGVTDLTSYRLGQMQERERIIKLLTDSCCESSDCICDNCLEVAVTIALIKGEM